jgi:hypothetical protein
MVLKSVERLRGGLRDALATGEGVAERLALAEVDAMIRIRVQGILVPAFVVGLLLGAAEAAAWLIGDPETLRLAVTSILLGAGLYGAWALIAGLIELLPLLAVWSATRLGPLKLARLLLYQFILGLLRRTFTTAEGRPSAAGRIARYALRFSGHAPGWEGLAYRLADQIAPRMLRHALIQAALVLLPVAAAWAYYRFKIFPDIIRAETGLGYFSAFLYPFAALADLIAGAGWREALIQGG